MRIFCLLLILSFLGCHTLRKADSNYPPFTFRHYRNIANYFNTLEEAKIFFGFRPGDKVADIGAGDGRYEAIFALMTDSAQFYAQDIDSKYLNRNKFDRYIRRYTSQRGKPQTNTFKVCIGTETETKLPDATFDKIIIMSAFHMFDRQDEMITDIRKKLKPGGKVYVLDTRCLAKSHKNYLPYEVVNKWTSLDFELLSIDTSNAHGSQDRYKAVFQRK